MFFKEIIGHNFITQSLKETVRSGKISHAYIFDGADGIGKEKVAKVFARAVLCEDFKDEVCDECKSCHLTKNDAHPDLKVLDLTIGEDGKQRASISVESIRQLKKEIYLKPFFSDRKIYILENAEKMTVEAQNAMLKIFEEPPSYITIILICNGLSKILSTIKSRAVIYKFPNLKPKELENYLNKYYNSIEDKNIYASISDGSISKMLNLISDEESLKFREEVLTGLVELIRAPSQTSHNSLFHIFMKNKDNKFDIINMLTVFIFDIAYLKTGNSEQMVNIDMIDELKSIESQLTVMNIYNMETYLADLSGQLSKNANYKLAVLNTLIKLREEIHG